MTSTDGLNLEQVQNQWRESQKLLDELRIRLESLATASQSAASAATSIQASEKSLSEILIGQSSMSEDFRRTYESAIAAVQALSDLMQANDLGHLSVQIQGVAKTLSEIEEAEQVERLKQRGEFNNFSDRLSGLEELLKASQSNSQALAAKEQELISLKNAVNRAINDLPGRFQTKFRGNLN